MTHPDYPDLPDLPDHAIAAVRRFEDELGELATQRERFGRLPLPDADELRTEPLDQRARRLRAAVESASAPVELIRLGRAVRAGKTTYEAIARGDADALPEVAEALASARQRFRTLVAEGVVRLVTDHDEAPGAAREPEPDDGPEPLLRPATVRRRSS